MNLIEMRSTTPLQERLLCALGVPPEELHRASLHAQIASTDRIHEVSINNLVATKASFSTSLQLIHRTHMSGIEHVVLSPERASNVLFHMQKGRIKQDADLGGQFRSSDALPILVSKGQNLLCSHYDDTAGFISLLGKIVDDIIPPDAKPEISITPDTVYHVLSAIQLAVLLIHPFIEANGRTSEDILHALWRRISYTNSLFIDTQRFPSENGQRNNKSVQERQALLDEGAKNIFFNIAKTLQAPQAKTFTDLEFLLTNGSHAQYASQAEFLQAYFFAYNSEILNLFSIIASGDIVQLKSSPIINSLAQNLRDASRTYTTASAA